MPAYAALVSLQQTLGIILDSGGLRILGIRGQLRSLGKQVDSFLDFLSNKSEGQIPDLETKMIKAAYAAEELIESHINTRFRNLLIIKSCNFICHVLVFLLFLSSVWIQRFSVWLLASIAIYMIRKAVMHLALGAKNELEAGELHRVSHYFDVIQTEVNGINEDRGEQKQAAQAELILLRQTLDSVLASGSGRFISDNSRDQLISLRDQVGPQSQWLDFPENIAADIRAAASKVKAFIESEFSVHHSIWRKFCDLIKVSLLASWFYLAALALLTIIILTFINYKLPVATSSHVIRVFTRLVARWLITLALIGIGARVLSTRSGEAIYLAIELAFVNRSNKSLEQKLSQEIGSLGEIMNQAIQPEDNASETASPTQDLEGRNAVVGLDSDILDIKELLEDSDKVEVISIVGMGGIGKTTLAKKVYDNAAVAHRFDIRGWVTISEKCTIHHVLQRLLASMNIDDDETSLGDQLHKTLYGRRFLIVIDDLRDREVLDFVKLNCPDNENGSRLLLTSRSSRGFAGRYCHKMRHLDKEESWVLLQKTIFGGGSCPENLKDCGKAIAKGCRGLPLAIVVIGRVLPTDDLSEWKKVEEKLINLQSTKLIKQCLEILGWSYDNLPHHLRPCFLYMGVFPTDSDEIPVSKLISLWVAEGFLKPCTPKSSEVVAEEYLKELIERNMISVSKWSCNDKIRTCSIHDLWRVFCVRTAYDQNFLRVVGEPSTGQMPNPQNPRRLSIYPDVVQVDACSRYLRSFFCSSHNCLSVGFSKFVYLRVLDVLVLHYEAFPSHVIELVSLRYLALSCNAPLPPSISKLVYLETIVHHHRSKQGYPLHPMVIWSMPNLRHLYVKPGCYLSNPLGCRSTITVVVAQHLQSLMEINNFKWSKDIIERIPNLKKLGILYDFSSSVDWSTYQLQYLVDLSQLEVLKITVKYNGNQSVDPPNLAFPQKLKKLSLRGCGIPWASIGALPNLEALKLRCEACSGLSWETVGEFPQLIYLLLEQLSFTRWETDESHFPRLRRLVLRSCGKLEEIPCAIGDIPTLEMIELVDCLPSATDSAEQIKQKQLDETGVSLLLRILDLKPHSVPTNLD